MIQNFLDAAGIVEVVWIDDHFAPMPLDVAVGRIKRHLRDAKSQSRSLNGIPHFSGIDLRAVLAAIEAQCDEVVLDLAENQVRDGETALGALVGAIPETTDLPDFTPQEFRDMQAAFGARLNGHTYSGTRWTAEGAPHYLSSTSTVLFVIDKEYRREPGSLDGLLFLRDLLRRPNSFCIMLTHTANDARAQDTNRVAFATMIGVAPHLFCVISKAQDRRLTVDQRFGRAIFEVFAHYLTGQLAFLLADAAANATVHAVAEISSESIYDIDRAIFENSIEEGCSEIDVLLRIFRARQKPKLNEAISTAAVQQALRALREFRAKTAELRPRFGSPEIDLKNFRAWRRDEVFDDGKAVNLLHTPLSCGDIFSVSLPGDKTKDYVLLAQPCALTVRGSDGERSGDVGMLLPVGEVVVASKPRTPDGPNAKTDEQDEDAPVGMLVPVSELARTRRATVPDREPAATKKAGKDEDSQYKHFEVKGVLEDNKVWRVDLRYTMYVPLRILELAVYNAAGEVQILRDHPEPDVVLPAGWKRRFQTTRSWFPPGRPGVDPSRLPAPNVKFPKPIGKGSGTLEPKISSTGIIYPLRRIGRVEANVADAIYTAWAVYQTRAAFDHDFARLDDEESDGPSETPAEAVGVVVDGDAQVQVRPAAAPNENSK